MADTNNRNKERDDYWDIDKLVPRRRAPLRPFATDVTPTTYEPESPKVTFTDTPERSSDDRRITISPSTDTALGEEESYIPEHAGLIKRVTITKTVDKYDFYDSFRRSALLYFDCLGNKCDYAEFYSFMPQYAHMSKAQQSYYLYWRSEVRRGRFIKTDYSYIYLYVYEILNLPDKIPKEEGIKLLTRVWREYRKALPRLDAIMAVWVQDYCLVHRLPSPTSEILDFMPHVLKSGVIKEFYLSDVDRLDLTATDLLVSSLTDYDWRGSKFTMNYDTDKLGVITSEEDYKREMLSAMRQVLADIWHNRIISDKERHVTVKRDAFPRSLLTHQVKCKLTVEYISFSSSEDIRIDVTSAVRYTENKLRKLLGVKSRLSVKEIPERYQRIIDEYFDTRFTEEKKKRAKESRPLYERLYEAESTILSFEGADEIERRSRETTERLVVSETIEENTASGYHNSHLSDSLTFAQDSGDLGAITHTVTASCDKCEDNTHAQDSGDLGAITHTVTVPSDKREDNTHAPYGISASVNRTEESVSPLFSVNSEYQNTALNTTSSIVNGENSDTAPEKHDNQETTRDTYGLKRDELLYLSYLAGMNQNYDLPKRLVADTLAERINEAFLENYGDVILESADLGYKIYDDYFEEIKEWLTTHVN